MKRGGFLLVVLALAAALVLGVAALYRLRVARGDVFPEYSSLRADPLGLRALHDAAGFLPGRESVRWLKPARRLETGAGDVVFVAGLDRMRRETLDTGDWAALDRAARAGARVVVAWHAELAQPADGVRVREVRTDPWAEDETEPEPEKPEADKADEKEKDEAELAEERRKRETAPPPRFASEHERRWGARLLRRELVNRVDEDDALRAEAAPADWPETLPSWRSDLFFLPRAGDGWRVLYRRGGEPVLMERARGAGTVVWLADSFVLSNEAVQRERATPVLAALLGDARRVIFVESHLGVKLDSGVAVLARRYGLGGAALTALLLAGLWIWRRASPLAPVVPEEAEVRLMLAPTAGLEALLRRAVAPAGLFAACVDAWRSGASEGDHRRLDAATARVAPGEPVAAYNAAARALSRKTLS